VNSWLILASPAGAGSRGSGNSVNVPKCAKLGVAHPDLSGAMDHRNAFIESNRALNQLLDRVLV
jgi:hypothetical protein